MADIQYLNYGDQQIEQQALLNNLANNVQNYVQNQSWSKKRKDKFMSAYSDLMNRGIIGASNNSGQWMIDVNGDPLPEMSKKDKEMYQEAAYFIQQQMASLPTKQAEEEKKEEEKAKLDVFNNEYFVNGFNTKLANDWFGGASFSRANDWNTLDERGENGLRGFKNRADRLAQSLQNYIDSLDENKLNFEGSAFKNLGDFKTKVGTAIQMLRTDPANAKDALNAIGLKFSDYLYNGAEDASGYQDKEGNPLTYQQVADVQQKAQEEADVLKAKEATIAQQQQANANKGILLPITGIHGTDARNNPQGYAEYISSKLGVGQQGFNAMNNLVQGLLDKAYSTGKLDSSEKKQLGNLLYYIRQNNPNYQGLGNGQKTNVTLEEFEELKKFQSFGENNIKNMVRLPWQTSDGRYTYADSKGNVYFLKPTNQKKFNAPAVNRSKQYYDYKNNFLKSKTQINNSQPVLNQDTDILISDMTSMLGDIVSLGGGYAGAAGGIATLASDLYGDIRRGKDTWSTLKNLGANIAWGAAGLIPGAKLGKLAKNAARIYATLQSAGILMNDEVQQSWKNLIAGKPITAKDFENFKWTLHAITGGTNAVRGHLTERNISKQVKTNSKPTIETKSGVKPITQEQVNKINKVGRKKGQEAAEKEFERIIGAKPKEGTFNFSENGTNKLNPTRYSQRLRNLISDDEKLILPKTNQSVNTQAVNKLLETDKTKPIFAPFSKKFWTTSELRKSGNPFNKRFWIEGGPNRGSLTFALTPYRTNNVDISSSQNSEYIPSVPNSPLKERNLNNYLDIKTPIKTQYQRRNMAQVEWEGKQAIKGQKEIDLFLKSYGKGNNSSKSSFVGGYGSSTNKIKPGEYSFDLGNGQKVKFSITKEEISKLPIGQLRNKIQKQIKEQVINKTDKATIGSILRKLKKQGFLKQGGTIDKQRIQRYKEYITK